MFVYVQDVSCCLFWVSWLFRSMILVWKGFAWAFVLGLFGSWTFGLFGTGCLGRVCLRLFMSSRRKHFNFSNHLAQAPA